MKSRPGMLVPTILLFLFTVTADAGTYSGGSGTPEDPYRISSIDDWHELIAAPSDWDQQFILLNDIDFGGADLTPVSADIDPTNPWSFQGIPFCGVFDGKSHVLRNAILNLPDMDFVGLFGCLGGSGRIQNLGVENCVVTGNSAVGGLCGSSIGTIRNCYATGYVNGGDWEVGGLCGENGGAIIDCYATGEVHGANWEVGGLCGGNYGGTISGCYAKGTVDGLNYVGGLCGLSDGMIVGCYAAGAIGGHESNAGGLCGANAGTISNCYATGFANVYSVDFVGGLCGQNFGSIRGCFATGIVSGLSYVGGLCGENAGTIRDCYATGDVNGSNDSFYVGGLCGGNYMGTILSCYAAGVVSSAGNFVDDLCGRNFQGVIAGCFSGRTGEMKIQTTFLDANWDFVGELANGTADIWRMCADGIDYPRLAWQFAKEGDFDCPDGVALDDLLYLANRWLAATPDTIGCADANSDGKVDLSDFAILAGDRGS